MNRKLIIGILSLFLPFLMFSQQQKMDTVEQTKETKIVKSKMLSSLNDGPYIFIEADQLVEKSIINGQVIVKELPKDAYQTKFKREKSTYKKVKKIAALSDIHGQHALAVEILTNHQIIDTLQNWNYGAGHLIIVGDIFDRGAQVNETLWLLYKLEKQAKAAGGKVHVLLGNHTQLYGKNTVMGRWLRSKATIVKINDNTFVHGGISKEFLNVPYNINQINRIMSESIDIAESVLDSTGVSYHYFGSSSPIWYRGYFNDNLPDEEISAILSDIYSKHIVVGHCSNETVVELYDGKVYGVDSSIKLGKYGELLLIEDKKYYRGTKDGERIGF